jgi:hypothetical protein
LMFKEAFPDNFRAYDEAVKRKEVTVQVAQSILLDKCRRIV